MKPFRNRITLAAVCAPLLTLAFAGSAHAAVVFDGTPATTAPPPTLGGYAMTAVPADGRPLSQDVTTVASPLGGGVSFNAPVSHRRVPSGGWGSRGPTTPTRARSTGLMAARPFSFAARQPRVSLLLASRSSSPSGTPPCRATTREGSYMSPSSSGARLTAGGGGFADWP